MSVVPDLFDVLVVGAGPSGAATAYWLAERGHRVLAVETSATLHHEPPGRPGEHDREHPPAGRCVDRHGRAAVRDEPAGVDGRRLVRFDPQSHGALHHAGASPRARAYDTTTDAAVGSRFVAGEGYEPYRYRPSRERAFGTALLRRLMRLRVEGGIADATSWVAWRTS